MATFCTNCGAPLSDAVMFCTACGAKNTAPQPAPVPVTSAQQPPPYAPQLPPAQKKLKPSLLIWAAAALVALVANIAISAH